MQKTKQNITVILSERINLRDFLDKNFEQHNMKVIRMEKQVLEKLKQEITKFDLKNKRFMFQLSIDKYAENLNLIMYLLNCDSFEVAEITSQSVSSYIRDNDNGYFVYMYKEDGSDDIWYEFMDENEETCIRTKKDTWLQSHVYGYFKSMERIASLKNNVSSKENNNEEYEI